MTMWDVALFELAEIDRLKEQRRSIRRYGGLGNEQYRDLNNEIVRRSRALEECLQWLLKAEKRKEE